ncbi:putative hydroxyindole O-methyltransferase [Xylariaceae sp. FL1019]|nr:putative hydroxyindole O-methyltransferase [Xylariaceae sp. FL1019]
MSDSIVPSILHSIAEAGKGYGEAEAGSREELIDLSHRLIAALELPSEFLQRSFWAEPAKSATIRLAVDVHLFQHLSSAREDGIHPAELADKCGMQFPLLQRLMRFLAAMHIVSYVDGKWHSTALADSLAKKNYQHSLKFCYDVTRPSFNGFPEFFQRTGYKQPTSLTDGPFQAAHKSELPLFEWLAATPPNIEHFSSFMASYRAGKPNWFDAGFYPVGERLLDGFDPSASDVLLVDVGGARGHELSAFATNHTSHPGKLVLQDRAEVIASLEKDDASRPFEAQTHDFFTVQPVRGARAYFLHSILHDWDDADGVRILENLKPALKPGYSRILLNEIVLSEDHPTLAATSMDMMMLAHFAVRERTEADWKRIIESAGLRVSGIYAYPGSAECVIEAELA